MQRSKHECVRLKPVRALQAIRSVVADADGRRVQFLDTGFWRFRCSLGRAGITYNKREGDGCTPVGRFEILEWRIRRDARVFKRPLGKCLVIRPLDGWCDDLGAGVYNRPIQLPSRLNHEEMWRLDNKYDVVAILNYNIKPRQRGHGSAIFFHICSTNFETTAGCVAILSASMNRLIPLLAPRASIDVFSARRKLPNRPAPRWRRA